MNSPFKSFAKRGLGEGLSMDCDQNVTENDTKQKVKPRKLFPKQEISIKIFPQQFRWFSQRLNLAPKGNSKYMLGTLFPTLLSFFTLLPESIPRVSYADFITKFSAIDRFPAFSFRYGAPLRANNRNVQALIG